MNPHLIPLLLGKKSLAGAVIAILRKYGTDAHVYLPGIGVINGLTAGNYLDSAGTTAATVDNPVGLVLDGAGAIDALQATTANKPILRKGAVNLLTYSEQFDNAAWTKTRSSISANATTAPNGTLTADKLVEDSTAASSHILDSATIAVINGLTYTTSIYAKAGERTKFSFRANNDAAVAVFDVSAGTVSGVSGGTAAIVDAGSGFYRCSLTWTATSTASVICLRVRMLDAAGNGTYTGDGTSGIYILGAMLSTGALADYAQTTTAPASNLVGGYHWVHDSTDLLTATFPAGYESATTINASTAGQSTLTAQSIVGAYNIGASIDTYGRFVFRTGLTDSELAIVQSFANRLAGL